MTSTLRTPLLTIVLVLAAACLPGCGGAEDRPAESRDSEPPAAETTDVDEPAEAEREAEPPTVEPAEDEAALARRPDGEAGMRVAAQRAQITTGSSDFGTVLFDANGQVVYVFEADARNQSNCTSAECVEAWPPVLTKQAPSAGRGIDQGKLGTIRREDGSMQVTYAGRPLYFYAHEARGEVKCHNVDIHGGLWWVVRPDGTPAPA